MDITTTILTNDLAGENLSETVVVIWVISVDKIIKRSAVFQEIDKVGIFSLRDF